ncbi:hypothetical protein [Methylovulum psychrotolerans]|jgi:hypothetical protein|uniref:Uncharacterized protein n=1 Tax=Methylovulum psychrotolerans TaxID=1704499 RepID=A0A1Z4BY34_9GAMM|nr:hypothetical protein [Methylovulum psychrotolerans]ASF46171.1 hypothetical protein CEK71_08795 [Methylovulum psychrotolerans]MBT9097569.1 hypothetical protein [Methylovulum psychrotolerans]
MADFSTANDINRLAMDYDKLLMLFNTFAQRVTAQEKRLGIHCTPPPYLAYGEFIIKLAGHTLHFTLASYINGGGKLAGKISCYQAHNYPQPTKVKIGAFAFNTQGNADLSAIDTNSRALNLTEEADTLALIMPFLVKSLAESD